MTDILVSLSYALRHPECTKTDPHELMRMAADRYDELLEEYNNVTELMKRLESAGLMCAEQLQNLRAAAWMFERGLSSDCDGPERTKLKNLLYDEGESNASK